MAVHDVVIPVPLTRLQCRGLESECAFPGAGLGGGAVFREGQLAAVGVPGAEEVDCAAVGGGAESEC